MWRSDGGLGKKINRLWAISEKGDRRDFIIDSTQTTGGLKNRKTDSQLNFSGMMSRGLPPYVGMRIRGINFKWRAMWIWTGGRVVRVLP